MKCKHEKAEIKSQDDTSIDAFCPAFSRMFGNGAIYSITVTDEKSAKMAAENFTPEPMDKWTVHHLIKQLPDLNEQDEEHF